MKRTLAVALLCAGIAAAAQQTINVTGDAEVKVAPDQVQISLGVETRAKTMSDARADNDRRVRGILASARRSGIQEKDIQTDFIQLGISYQSDGLTPQYYYARKSIELVLRDVNRMEQTLSAAVDAGATHIHGVQFTTTKFRENRDKARSLAVTAAMEKARDMATAAGMKVVGGPTGISAFQYGGQSWYASGWGYGSGAYAGRAQNVIVDAGSNAGGAAQGTVALGRISITAAVSMTFRIE
jgi:uncharacterized protein YggE